jgi:hypothetical protein
MRVRAVAVGSLVVLMVSAGVSSAATTPGGTYTGQTSQSHGTITFRVSGGKITRIAFVDGTGVGKGCASVGAPHRSIRSSSVPTSNLQRAVTSVQPRHRVRMRSSRSPGS